MEVRVRGQFVGDNMFIHVPDSEQFALEIRRPGNKDQKIMFSERPADTPPPTEFGIKMSNLMTLIDQAKASWIIENVLENFRAKPGELETVARVCFTWQSKLWDQEFRMRLKSYYNSK